ncbi:MAG: glutamine synthetase III, partial [Coriobacteriales bacterium]
MPKTSEDYGKMVFNDHVMKERLPTVTYKKLKASIDNGEKITPGIANEVAHAMKEWAIELGATHFTHWFQPLSGVTSEKHDSFITPSSDGRALMTFSGKELIQGEPDASSFPSGGLRATFEARGYTAWDPTSYAFIKDEVLCIPTAFCSYTGEALDKKTPLLRSMEAVSTQAERVVHLFGQDIGPITTFVGPEQEYFLIMREDYAKRLDLVLTGRTLFGCPPCKGQELEEHYFGTIRPRVSRYMKELDEELWKLGVPARIKHNEVAPAQHELAPLYETSNVAVDANLLTMEMMRTVATRYDMICLQHEKPFSGINGSGKHNNWSIGSRSVNLLDPTEHPSTNLRFLVFLSAVIEAVYNYQDLLRASVATAGNDMRLGANEAPPAIVSIFLGDDLNDLVESLIHDEVEYHETSEGYMDIGVNVIPNLKKDTTDRNRTSPFAFTGNKFEFRMPGSAMNLADANYVLNTAVAKSLKDFADIMQASDNVNEAAFNHVKEVLRKSEPIIFNGNGYSDEWKAEAERRGLANLPSTPDAAPAIIAEKNVKLCEEMGVLSRVESESRYNAKIEQYSKIINIEAQTMLNMADTLYLPAVSKFSGDVSSSLVSKKELGVKSRAEEGLLKRLVDGLDNISDAIEDLYGREQEASKKEDSMERARAYHDIV